MRGLGALAVVSDLIPSFAARGDIDFVFVLPVILNLLLAGGSTAGDVLPHLDDLGKVFTMTDLSDAPHTLKIVKTSGSWIGIDGYETRSE